MTKKTLYILAIVTVTLLTTILHFVTMQAFSPNVILEELYYLPLLLGVLRFGQRGAVLTWIFVSLAYLPFFFPPWTTSFPGYVDRSLHLALSGVVVIVFSILVERERKNRAQAERERYLAGIGRVATVIVHDLKNQLISILGFARRISEGKADCESAAQTIAEAAQSMQRIVNEVLDFAKPLQLDLKESDIGVTIQRAVESCRTKAAERAVLLTVTPPKGCGPIMIDTFQVERALVNLLDNAVEASPAGAEVIVSTTLNRTGVILSIKDAGEGMANEVLAHLFDPFYTTKSGGTGLGLPIAKKIFTEHGGKLVINSRKGEGTEAKIWLPPAEVTTPAVKV